MKAKFWIIDLDNLHKFEATDSQWDDIIHPMGYEEDMDLDINGDLCVDTAEYQDIKRHLSI